MVNKRKNSLFFVPLFTDPISASSTLPENAYMLSLEKCMVDSCINAVLSVHSEISLLFNPNYSRKLNAEQWSNQILYLVYVRCFHVVQTTADHLKYLLPQLLPILTPSTFSLLGTVHQN